MQTEKRQHLVRLASLSLFAVVFLLVWYAPWSDAKKSHAASSEKEAMVLLMPPTNKAIVKECAADVAGRISNDEISSVDLYREITLTRAFTLLTADQHRGFTHEFSTFWIDDITAKSLHIVGIPFQGDTIVQDWEWNLSVAQTNQSFWNSTAGDQLIKLINNPSIKQININIIGWLHTAALISGEGANRWFQSSIALAPGENVIELAGRKSDRSLVHVDTLHMYYLIDAIADAPGSGYAKYSFHDGPVEKMCRDCHPQKSPSSKDACQPCHDNFQNQRFTHTPAKRHLCFACHDSGSPKYATIKALGTDADLCNTCHTKQKAEWSADSMQRHAPVDAGQCLQCHTPHGSPNIFHTVAPINQMCSACHDKIEEFKHPILGHPHSGRPELARPGRELSCSGCHNPHASKFEHMLRYGNGMAECLACHPK